MAAEVAVAPLPSCPDVSISLVTRNRPLFLEHALELIAAQDFPIDRIEVVLVDSSDAPVEPLLVRWPVYAALGERIRYFRAERPASIGEQRNFAVRQSRGSIVMQWDDDDYYGPSRVRAQAAPIREGRARCTALAFGYWYFLDQDEFWLGPPPELGHGLCGGHPGTLAFDRTIWSEADARLQYPPTSFADPDEFQAAAAELLHARTEEVGDEVDFVYVRHRHAAVSCEGELQLGIEECVLGIYFEVLGVRGFGRQVAPPAFVPRGTLERWGRIRDAQAGPATLGPAAPCADIGARFDRHASDALRLLHRTLLRYPDADLQRWTRGEALTDGTRKRQEIREAFLRDVLPALVSRVAHSPGRFQACALAHALLACHRLGHAGGGFLSAVATALWSRRNECDGACAEQVAAALCCCEGYDVAGPAAASQGAAAEEFERVD